MGRSTEEELVVVVVVPSCEDAAGCTRLIVRRLSKGLLLDNFLRSTLSGGMLFTAAVGSKKGLSVTLLVKDEDEEDVEVL